MHEGMKRILRALARDNELFSLMSTIIKKYYDALIEVGFTKEQAATIVAQFNIKIR